MATTTRRSAIVMTALLPLGTPCAHAYQFNDSNRWARTATVVGGGLSQGDPTTVTWSLAPDGTAVPGLDPGNGPSTLVAFLDALYPGGTGGDLRARPWFYLFEQSFQRWEAVSGLTFVYEDDDDGVSFSGIHLRRGILDVRGDIRIGARYLDGQDGQNTIAFAYGPDYGELVLDAGNTDLFGNTFNQARAARNVITHELGHALGLNHVQSTDANFLMEPGLNVGFDGPQLDDILAVQRGYGDRYEKTNNNAGNDTPALATPLGVLIDGVTTSIGTDADDAVVAGADVDFVSIDDDRDVDFFSFTIDAPAEIRVTLTPRGPTYNSGPEGGTQSPVNTAALSDLSLALVDTDGTSLLALRDEAGRGAIESIAGVTADQPGTYFVRVTGDDDAPQLYQLDLLVTAITPIPGDLDNDQDVDPNDLFIVLDHFGDAATPGSLIVGDTTGDGAVGVDDLDLLLANWTGPSHASSTVPEPTGAAAAALGLIALRRRRGGLFVQRRLADRRSPRSSSTRPNQCSGVS
ncbi:MAG: matrixin family metalloprotease [Phycisphaeraceae bacterium]